MNSAKKKSFFVAVICLILCVALLVGTTFAWFSDSVSNTGNRIQAGTLDVDLLKAPAYNGTYTSIAGGTGDIFTDSGSSGALWEPGQTQLAYLAVKNNGNLALKYNIVLDITDKETNTGKDTNGMAESLEFAIVNNPTAAITDWKDAVSKATVTGRLSDYLGGKKSGQVTAAPQGSLKTQDAEDKFAIVIHMSEEAGNVYQNGLVVIDMHVNATQETYEKDGFGSDQYDAQAVKPTTSTATSAPVKAEVTGDQTFNVSGDITSAKAEAAAVNGVFNARKDAQAESNELTLTLNIQKSELKSEVQQSGDTKYTQPLDISMTSVMKITKGGTTTTTTSNETLLAGYAMAEMNIGKGLLYVKVTHNGNDMATSKEGDTSGYGYYTYDSATGKLNIYTKTFSPFVITYTKPLAEVIVSRTGEESVGMSLAEFRDSVNAGNAYEGYTVTLQKDINLSGVNWVGIGTEATPFAGSFDGNNKTITGLAKTTFNEAEYWEGEIEETPFGLFSGVKSPAGKTVEYKNLTLKDVSINLGDKGKQVGSLIGFVTASPGNLIVDNVDVTGTSVINGKQHVGGIIGKSYAQGSVLIKNCDNYATVSSNSSTNLGGIASRLQKSKDVKVINCINNGSVSTKGSYLGGIAGLVDVDNGNVLFESCVNNADIVTASTNTGGILGDIDGSNNNETLTLKNLTNNGSISSLNEAVNKNVGAIVGGNTGERIANIIFEGSIINTASIGSNMYATQVFGHSDHYSDEVNINYTQATFSLTGSNTTTAPTFEKGGKTYSYAVKYWTLGTDRDLITTGRYVLCDSIN